MTYDEMKAVVDALERADWWVRPADLSEAVPGVPLAALRAFLGRLKAGGRVERRLHAPQGRGGPRYWYYRIKRERS